MSENYAVRVRRDAEGSTFHWIKFRLALLLYKLWILARPSQVRPLSSIESEALPIVSTCARLQRPHPFCADSLKEKRPILYRIGRSLAPGLRRGR